MQRRTTVPLRERAGWQQDSDLAALTVVQAGGQRTWRNEHLNAEDGPLIDAWAATALDAAHAYRRLTMVGLAALRICAPESM